MVISTTASYRPSPHLNRFLDVFYVGITSAVCIKIPTQYRENKTRVTFGFLLAKWVKTTAKKLFNFAKNGSHAFITEYYPVQLYYFLHKCYSS
jgi:hypothetical protein